jgi:peptide/nickel transport system substrate-binding protein
MTKTRTLLSGTAAATSPTAGAEALEEVPRNRTVILENIEGRVDLPDNMNPYVPGVILENGVWQATLESLFYSNYETGQLIPWLASGHSYSADQKHVTITIRDGVKWSDGVPFTADDVAFTINMLKSNDALKYSADMKQWVANVVAADHHTVEITLTSPNPRFVVDYFGVRIWNTILVMPKHIWEHQDPLTFKNLDLAKGWPIGTGPYRVVRATATETVFDRRDDWWAATTGFHSAPAPERAIWSVAPTEEIRAAKAANNELDAMWTLGRVAFETVRAKNPNIVGWTKHLPYAYLDPVPATLVLSNAVAPFDDSAVRWAISYALDREEISEVVYEGLSEATDSIFPLYPGLKAYLDRNKALLIKYPMSQHNLDRSAQLMSSKGFRRDAEGFWVGSDGKRISFATIVRGPREENLKMGDVFVRQLRKAGFDASCQAREGAVFYDEISRGLAKAYGIGVSGSATGSDPYKSFSFLHSRNATPLGVPAPNHGAATRFKNAEFDHLVDQMAAMSPDDPKFAAIADKALEIFARELPVIPVTQRRPLTPFNNMYWTNWPTAENNYVQPGHWWVTGLHILLNIKPAK